ncbi:tyrosine-type recombinase/integrase [Bradyrhizobium genomosp. III]|uniref:tyrosine-type recombinase/integrase n=1 Tax=Bradyrhizobium genomosp. III TaxID=2683271 RepID=UPI0004BBE9F5|nr:site-specific integrase [Bradyrhizobium sp. CCBAU 15615]
MPENGREEDHCKGVISPTTPLLLEAAANIAFPDGSMTLAGLRREIGRGRLAYESIDGKLYTTLADIGFMREACRVEAATTGMSGFRRPAQGPRPSTQPRTFDAVNGQSSHALLQQSQALHAERRSGSSTAGIRAPAERARDIDDTMISVVLASYYQDKCRATDVDKNLVGHINRLNAFWGNRALIQINPKTCRDYVSSRPGPGGARRDLEVLRAAINNHAEQNLHFGTVNVTLPPKGEARQQWLTRGQVAAIIWAAWRYREVQTIHCGRDKGKRIATDRRPLQHVARFLLIGCYTGTRAGAIASASIKQDAGKSHVDLDAGLYYRQPIGRRRTKKRQTVVPLPPRLLHHMRRWVRLGIIRENFVEYRGRPVQSVKKGFASAVRLAKLDIKATPHTLRHTAATWLMQAGVKEWDAAGYLGMSVDVLRNVYGHHHPDFMKSAVIGVSSKNKTSGS